MKIFKSKHKLKEEISNIKDISFVPTMGGLHKGHISLIKKSQNFKGKTLVSNFVNPTQFNKKNDFLNYPRNLKKDLKILKNLNVDLIYLPNLKDIFAFKVKKKHEVVFWTDTLYMGMKVGKKGQSAPHAKIGEKTS